jgi:hypothetical protein
MGEMIVAHSPHIIHMQVLLKGMILSGEVAI